MTAVEWLETIMPKLVYISKSNKVKFDELIKQAKEMEKENVFLFAKEYDEYLFRGCGLPRLTAEQYYNQTFKQD